jgi:uncharacterized protein YdhG (YjbR/CyaY superfamily)
MVQAKEVSAYYKALTEPHKSAIQKLRGQILEVCPDADEKMAWGMRTFVFHGNLVHIAAFKKHCSFFPGSGAITEIMKGDLEKFVTSKGTIQFDPERGLPKTIVTKIVKYRMKENLSKEK